MRESPLELAEWLTSIHCPPVFPSRLDYDVTTNKHNIYAEKLLAYLQRLFCKMIVEWNDTHCVSLQPKV